MKSMKNIRLGVAVLSAVFACQVSNASASTEFSPEQQLYNGAIVTAGDMPPSSGIGAPTSPIQIPTHEHYNGKEQGVLPSFGITPPTNTILPPRTASHNLDPQQCLEAFSKACDEKNLNELLCTAYVAMKMNENNKHDIFARIRHLISTEKKEYKLPGLDSFLQILNFPDRMEFLLDIGNRKSAELEAFTRFAEWYFEGYKREKKPLDELRQVTPQTEAGKRLLCELIDTYSLWFNLKH